VAARSLIKTRCSAPKHTKSRGPYTEISLVHAFKWTNELSVYGYSSAHLRNIAPRNVATYILREDGKPLTFTIQFGLPEIRTSGFPLFPLSRFFSASQHFCWEHADSFPSVPIKPIFFQQVRIFVGNMPIHFPLFPLSRFFSASQHFCWAHADSFLTLPLLSKPKPLIFWSHADTPKS